MSKTPNSNNIENLRTMYNALVDYHISLVNMRFTIAALYLTATSFLANSWFSDRPSDPSKIPILILGILITFVCWIMDIRTYSLVFNTGKRGLDIEQQLYAGPNLGFFDLMRDQPCPPTIPFSKIAISLKDSKLLSQSNALNLLYSITLAFWIWQINHLFALIYAITLISWIFLNLINQETAS